MGPSFGPKRGDLAMGPNQETQSLDPTSGPSLGTQSSGATLQTQTLDPTRIVEIILGLSCGTKT